MLVRVFVGTSLEIRVHMRNATTPSLCLARAVHKRPPTPQQGRLAEWGSGTVTPLPRPGALPLFPTLTTLVPGTFHERFFVAWFVLGLSTLLAALFLLIIFARD